MPKTTTFLTGAHTTKNRWLAGLLMAIFCGMAAAADNEDEDGGRWYEVELILFAHNNPQALDAEQWPAIIGVDLPMEELVELQLPQEITPTAADEIMRVKSSTAETPVGDTTKAPVAFQLLDESEWQLQKTARRLRRSSRFEPLLHVAWRQPTYERASARPVLLYDDMTKPLIIGGQPQSQTETHAGPPNPKLIGTVTLSVARYLHLATDLIYRIPVTQQTAVPVPDFDLWYDRPYPTLYEPQGPAYRLKEWQAIRGFRMRESRRMRSKVMHYLDHPLFGLVVLITPVKLPQTEETETTVTQ
ncbi:MAG TPA: hypothetical protein ENH21_05990 [Chromatiales bacterium]|nr:hypothetical protein [Chromatiales bacterium]HEX22966.1 hypothetical protein [Chromatiales bacterium]